MALYGVIADIHGNREALAAALAALEARGAQARGDRLLCLGDIVGYNADPDECVALVRERRALAIAGNHDLIGLGRLGFRRCSTKAEYSLRRTRRSLGAEAAAWLATLPPQRVLAGGVVLIHGGVRDVQEYMTTPALVGRNAAELLREVPQARLCFFGHSHEQRVYEVHPDNEVRGVSFEEKILLKKDLLYFINPGSVDASRKRGAKLAECAILDTDEWSVEFLRAPYDAAATEAKAAVFGYRIDAWTERLYRLRRRLSRGLARAAGA
jgi:predicted phosphodiesterase